MNKAIQINENSIVFSQEALNAAAEQGAIEPEYMQAIRREQAAEAITGALEGAREAVTGFIGGVAANAKLEARMFVFDTLHGTNYRSIRHAVVEEKRRREFEASIGLERTK